MEFKMTIPYGEGGYGKFVIPLINSLAPEFEGRKIVKAVVRDGELTILFAADGRKMDFFKAARIDEVEIAGRKFPIAGVSLEESGMTTEAAELPLQPGMVVLVYRLNGVDPSWDYVFDNPAVVIFKTFYGEIRI
ncbi:MAG TPA: hypothetical protein PKY08_01560 [Candidatus Magasanikbacteria bacterium]|nr:hypothetical protein [Candidatus Magasanikbacteria bacterium]